MITVEYFVEAWYSFSTMWHPIGTSEPITDIEEAREILAECKKDQSATAKYRITKTTKTVEVVE